MATWCSFRPGVTGGSGVPSAVGTVTPSRSQTASVSFAKVLAAMSRVLRTSLREGSFISAIGAAKSVAGARARSRTSGERNTW